MSETTIERILEKITALFNLAQDSAASKTEKENAIKAAQKLIARYQLDNIINKNIQHDNYVESVIFNGQNKNRITWKEKLFFGICHTNGCEIILHKDNDLYYYTCFGRKENVEICKRLIELILPQIESFAKEDKKLYEEYIGQRKRGPSKESFKLGCVQRIIDKINESRDDEINLYIKEITKKQSIDSNSIENALIVAISDFNKELERSQEILKMKIKSLNKNMKKSSVKNKTEKINPSDFNRGLNAAENIDINLFKMINK